MGLNIAIESGHFESRTPKGIGIASQTGNVSCEVQTGSKFGKVSSAQGRQGWILLKANFSASSSDEMSLLQENMRNR